MAAAGKTPPAPAGGAAPTKSRGKAKPKGQGKLPGKPAGSVQPAEQSADGYEASVTVSVVWAAVGVDVKHHWETQGMRFVTPNVRRWLDQRAISDKNVLICPLPREMVDLLRKGGVRRVKQVKGKRLPTLHLFPAETAESVFDNERLVAQNYTQWSEYKQTHQPKPFHIDASGWNKDLEF